MSDDRSGVPEKERFEAFWKLVCSYLQFWLALFYLNVVFLVGLLFSFLFDLSPGARAIAVVDLVLVLVVLGGTGYVVRKCQSRSV